MKVLILSLERIIPQKTIFIKKNCVGAIFSNINNDSALGGVVYKRRTECQRLGIERGWLLQKTRGQITNSRNVLFFCSRSDNSLFCFAVLPAYIYFVARYGHHAGNVAHNFFRVIDLASAIIAQNRVRVALFVGNDKKHRDVFSIPQRAVFFEKFFLQRHPWFGVAQRCGKRNLISSAICPPIPLSFEKNDVCFFIR